MWKKKHLKFCKKKKKIPAVKQFTQSDLTNGETRRTPSQTKRYMDIIKYWLKVTSSQNRKFIKAPIICY